MTEKEKNDYFYVCSLIEYIARETKNKRGVIVQMLGKKGVEKLLCDADVNHCLSFEQVSDEVIEQYGILNGDFDTITECKYEQWCILNKITSLKLYFVIAYQIRRRLFGTIAQGSADRPVYGQLNYRLSGLRE